jgi:putative hydroxymethylpyrimidine transport system substrate-binding protein
MTHSLRISGAALAASAMAAVALLAGCSAAEPAAVPAAATATSDVALSEMTHVTLLLDYFVYGAHAGVYEALEKGYYADNNIDLEIIVPNDPVASLKFVQAGQADIGFASPLDLVSLVSQDSEYSAFMSLVGGNLEGMAVLASAGIDSPADLEGKTVGTSGSVSHNAMARAQIEGAGGDPDAVEMITVGSGFMQYLVDGQVDAVVSFKPDVAAAEAAGEDVTFLPVGQDGGLAFPSIVVYANNDTISGDPEMIAAFVDATVKGYEDLLDDPESAAQATVDATAGLELDGMLSQVEGIGNSFLPSSGTFGDIDAEQLQSLVDFMSANGFIENAPDVESFVTTEFTN